MRHWKTENLLTFRIRVHSFENQYETLKLNLVLTLHN